MTHSDGHQVERTLRLIEQGQSLRFSSVFESKEYFDQAVTAAGKARDPILLGRALTRRSEANRLLGNDRAANLDADRALRLVASLNHPIVISLLCEIAIASSQNSECEKAQALFLRALEVAEAIDDPLGQANVLTNLGYLARQMGDIEGAFEYFKKSTSLASAIQAHNEFSRALTALGALSVATGDVTSAEAYFKEALGTVGMENNNSLKLFVYKGLSEVCLLKSQPKGALEYSTLAVDTAESFGGHDELRLALIVYGKSCCMSRDYKGAQESMNQVLELEPPAGLAAVVYAIKAFAHAAVGSENEATGCLERSRELVEPTNVDFLEDILEYSSLAKSCIGDMRGAFEDSRRQISLRDRQYTSTVRTAIGSLRFLMDTERERHEAQLTRLKAQTLEQDLSNTTLQLVAQTELLTELRNDLLKVIRKFPMPDAAAKELRERLKTLPCKSVDWERFDTQFKAAHPEFTKKLLEKCAELSPTEVRICSLLRMNLRSAEIARLLCLSERTVENHRMHIRKKMKVQASQDLIKLLSAM